MCLFVHVCDKQTVMELVLDVKGMVFYYYYHYPTTTVTCVWYV